MYSLADAASPWNWSAICPTGLQPLMPPSDDTSSRQLEPCFQKLCLQMPLLALLTLYSAYKLGAMTGGEMRWHRDRIQLWSLTVRMWAVGLLAVLPLARYMLVTAAEALPVDLWLDILEMMTFVVHFAFLHSLRSHGSRNHRGPLGLCIVWIMLFAVSFTNFQWPNNWPVHVAPILLHTVYAVTLLPGGSAEPHRRLSTDDGDTPLLTDNRSQPALGRAEEDAWIGARLTFGWVTALISKGLKPDGLRSVDDLFRLPSSLHIDRLAAGIQIALDRTPQLLWALHRAHGFEFYAIGLVRLVSDAAGFAGPLLLSALLTPPTSEEAVVVSTLPYWYAFGLFASTLLAALSSAHFTWRLAMIKAKMQVSIVTAIYAKALDARSLDDARPEILNLMSTDAMRVVNACQCFHDLWSIPLQIAVSLYLLYVQIGLAFVAGLAFVLALVPLNHWVVKRMNAIEKRILAAKDARIGACTEALAGAKSIKLMAWERLFATKICALRAVEMACLRAYMTLNAWTVYLWSATPALMSLLTFGTAVLSGQRLTPASTFTAVALLNMLMVPLNIVPWVLNMIIDSWVSLRRIQELLDLPSVDLLAYYTPIPHPDPPAIQIRNASFTFEQLRSREGVDDADAANIVDFRLDDVNLSVRHGQLVCLRGPLGGGKSTLLNAMLAKMQPCGGSIGVADVAAGFGYVAQTAWLQRGTVRDNIVWGAAFDEHRYKRVLHACALTEDLLALGGDLTGIGEAGQTLSGGQKARVALARAVYQDKELYLLDDVLSALDGHVANHIVRHCLFGLLARETRVIVTDHPAMLAYADQVYEVTDGRVKAVGSAVADKSLAEFRQGAQAEADAALESLDLAQDGVKLQETNDSVLDEESKESGTVAADVIVTYLRAMGWTAATVVLALVIAQRLSESLTDLWLARWVSENARTNGTAFESGGLTNLDPRSWWNLEVYSTLAATNSVVTLIRSFVFAYAAVRASRVVHERLLKRVLGARFAFFDSTPLGRLINRFSSDMDTVDARLPFVISYFLTQVSGLLAALAITVLALPWIMLLVAPLTLVYLRLQSRYRQSSREVQRFASNAMSPLYTHFTETLQGLATVRAMRAAPRFRAEFAAKLAQCTRARLTASAAESWLNIRLQCIGAVLVGGCGLIAAVTAQHASNAGMVGLAISYALTITELLAAVMNAVARSEQQLIAMERIKSYCELEPEEKSDDGLVDQQTIVGATWPEAGVVRFRNVRLQYRANLTPSLCDVDLETRAGERLGVAGRTGAGKSSLLAALFRVAPLSGGSVTVDGVDVARLPLRLLRSRLALVPQQPFLFAATVRENLDLGGERTDAQLWSALDVCRAGNVVRSLGGLSGKLEKSGGNLSAGQKQLVCLTRALLRGSRLVCIDEGTANLDAVAERDVQQVLREAFGGATVVLIAHRMTSLLSADRVAVMQAGRVVEMGEVEELADDVRSVFNGMMQEQKGMGETDGKEGNVRKLVDV